MTLDNTNPCLGLQWQKISDNTDHYPKREILQDKEHQILHDKPRTIQRLERRPLQTGQTVLAGVPPPTRHVSRRRYVTGLFDGRQKEMGNA